MDAAADPVGRASYLPADSSQDWRRCWSHGSTGR